MVKKVLNSTRIPRNPYMSKASIVLEWRGGEWGRVEVGRVGVKSYSNRHTRLVCQWAGSLKKFPALFVEGVHL